MRTSWAAEDHNANYGVNLNNGLCNYIVNQKFDSVLEFGCGIAALANTACKSGSIKKWVGIEPRIQLEDQHSNFTLRNIDITSGEHHSVCNHYFDAIVSIEVLEHIPLESHATVFNFLTARCRDTMIFSAARPGQGGIGHISERREQEWRAEIISRGLVFCEEETLRIRNMSDRKNVNHVRNLQVFKIPESARELINVESQLLDDLKDLNSICDSHSKYMIGNLCYENATDALALIPSVSLRSKRINIMTAARMARSALEIGFAGGHSALLMLTANPQLKLTIIDPFEAPYSAACFEYLQKAFPGRINLLSGFSNDFYDKDLADFDLIHLDGGKEKTILNDLTWISNKSVSGCTVVVDDTHNLGVLKALQHAIAIDDFYVTELQLLLNERVKCEKWPHMVVTTK